MWRLIKKYNSGKVEIIKDNITLSEAKYYKLEKSYADKSARYEVEEKCSCADSHVCCPEGVETAHCAYCKKAI